MSDVNIPIFLNVFIFGFSQLLKKLKSTRNKNFLLSVPKAPTTNCIKTNFGPAH